MRSGLAAALAAAVLTCGLASGCGTFARDYPPTGVDQLTIPTPSPDPHDFVAGVDHEFWPLEPGTSLTYEVWPADELVTVTVGGAGDPADAAPEIAGVATTAVHTVASGGGGEVSRETRYYAQDRSGNVWLLGVDGPVSWRAGVDGAQAGLALAAEPRFGDGHRTGLAPGFEEVVEVVGRDDTPGSRRVVLERRSGTELWREEYAAGTGLIRRTELTSGRSERLRAG